MDFSLSTEVLSDLKKIKQKQPKLFKRIQKQLKLFKTNIKHPSLRIHKLKGNLSNTWSISVDNHLKEGSATRGGNSILPSLLVIVFPAHRSIQKTAYRGTLRMLLSNPKFFVDIRIAYGGLYSDMNKFRLLAFTLSEDFVSIGIICPLLSCTTKSSSAVPDETQ